MVSFLLFPRPCATSAPLGWYFIITHVYIIILVKDEGLPRFIINIFFYQDTSGIKNSSLIINLSFDCNAIESLSRHIIRSSCKIKQKTLMIWKWWIHCRINNDGFIVVLTMMDSLSYWIELNFATFCCEFVLCALTTTELRFSRMLGLELNLHFLPKSCLW